MKKQSVKKKSGSRLSLHEKVKAESEREESNDGSVLSRSQTPIQNSNKPILISEVADGNDLNPYIIPDNFKEILAQDWAEINVAKNIKTFTPIMLNSGENIDDISVLHLSVSDILTNFTDTCIQNHIEMIKKENFEVEEGLISPEYINHLDGSTLVKISERTDFCRGLAQYFDAVFDKRLLYKSEKQFYKRASTMPKLDAPEPSIQNGSKKVSSITFNPSQNVGLIHLLRLLVLLPELLSESGLTSAHIQKLYLLVDELLDFLNGKMIKQL